QQLWTMIKEQVRTALQPPSRRRSTFVTHQSVVLPSLCFLVRRAWKRLRKHFWTERTPQQIFNTKRRCTGVQVRSLPIVRPLERGCPSLHLHPEVRLSQRE